MDVKMPDGTIIQNVPDNITQSELMRRVEMLNAPAAPQAAPEKQSIGSRLFHDTFDPYINTAAGVYRGVQNVTDTLAQGGASTTDYASGLFGKELNTRKSINDTIKQNRDAYNQNYKDSTAARLGEIGGEIIGTLPASELKIAQGLGMVGKMLNSALQGGTAAALTSSAYEEPGAKQAITGSAIGAFVPPAMSGAAKLGMPIIKGVQELYNTGAQKFGGAINTANQVAQDVGAIRQALEKGNPNAADALGEYLSVQLGKVGVDYQALMPKVQKSLLEDAQKSLRMTGQLSPEMLLRSADMKALGMKGTLGAVSRDPRVWQFEQNTAGVSGEAGNALTQRFTEDNRVLSDSLKKLKKQTGGTAATPYEAGEGATESITTKYAEMQKAIGDQYKLIREAKGNDIGLRPNRLFAAIEEHADEAAADPVVSSVKRRMQRLSLIDGEGNFDPKTVLQVDKAEELRKFINRLSDGGDPAVKRIKGNIINALDDDVIETTGEDAFMKARDSARKRFAEFSAKPLAGATEGRIAPDDFLRKNILSGKVADIKALKQSLTTGNDEQISRGGAAWDDLRLQTMQHIIDQSTDAGGKIQGSRLAKALDSIGKERLETIFAKEELSQLGTIKRAAYNTTVAVPESHVNYSGTGAFLADLLGRSGIGKNIVKATNAVTNVPIIGPLVSPVTGAVNLGGKLIDEAATTKAAQKSLSADPLAIERAEKSALLSKKLAEALSKMPTAQAAIALANALRKPSN